MGPPAVVYDPSHPSRLPNKGHNLAVFCGRWGKIAQRRTGNLVGVVGDVCRVGSLNHRDRGVVIGRHDPDRHVGEQLPDDEL